MPKFDPRAASRPMSDTNLAGRDNAKGSDQFRRSIATYLADDLCLCRVRQTRKTKQDNAGMNEALPEDELAEVLVRRQQDGPPRVGLLQHVLVRHAWRQLRDVDHVMAVLA